MTDPSPLQAEIGAVGSLGLQTLASFPKLVSALSCDDVQPAALLQMKDIGTLFPISGKHAACVPDLLQRFSSHRYERLALSIGWRKGDTAAELSRFAGGQAIALLSHVLLSLYRVEDVGGIFRVVSNRLLPTLEFASSIRQLGAVAKLLDRKLGALGFGNILAQQVDRIHQAFHQMGKPVPPYLLYHFTAETMQDVLVYIS